MKQNLTSPLLKALNEFDPAPPGSLGRNVEGMKNPHYIHICKDGTFTFRTKGQKVFNGAALPVFVVESREQAISLQVLMCFTVHATHPKLPKGEPWYKLNDVRTSPHSSGGYPVFDVEDLPRITSKMEAVFHAHIKKNL